MFLFFLFCFSFSFYFNKVDVSPFFFLHLFCFSLLVCSSFLFFFFHLSIFRVCFVLDVLNSVPDLLLVSFLFISHFLDHLGLNSGSKSCHVSMNWPSAPNSHMLYSRNTNMSGNIINHDLQTSMNEQTHFFIKIYLSHFILKRVDVSEVCERWVETGTDCYIDPTSSLDHSTLSYLQEPTWHFFRILAMFAQAGIA